MLHGAQIGLICAVKVVVMVGFAVIFLRIGAEIFSHVQAVNAARIQSSEEVRAHGIIRVGAGREVRRIFVPQSTALLGNGQIDELCTDSLTRRAHLRERIQYGLHIFMVIIGARLAVIGQQRIACDNRVADDRIVQRKLLADVQPQQRNTAGKVVADIGLYIGEKRAVQHGLYARHRKDCQPAVFVKRAFFLRDEYTDSRKNGQRAAEQNGFDNMLRIFHGLSLLRNGSR